MPDVIVTASHLQAAFDAIFVAEYIIGNERVADREARGTLAPVAHIDP